MTETGPVITIGETLIDLIADAGVPLHLADRLTIREGGAPANVAVALARLGVPSQLRSVVGDDPFGRRIIDRLAAEGVDTSTIRIATGQPTTLALAWSNEHGDGSFRLIRLADSQLSPDDVSAGSLDGAAAIVVGSVSLCAEPSRDAVLLAIQRAQELSIPVVADLNIRPGQIPPDELRMLATVLITSASLLKLSVDDARELWGAATITETAAVLVRYGVALAVITDAASGAAMVVDGVLMSRPAFAVDAVEPTGAGDAFTAAFISRMIGRAWVGAELDDLRFAMAAGALATTRRGAMDGLPTADQVTRFLQQAG